MTTPSPLNVCACIHHSLKTEFGVNNIFTLEQLRRLHPTFDPNNVSGAVRLMQDKGWIERLGKIPGKTRYKSVWRILPTCIAAPTSSYRGRGFVTRRSNKPKNDNTNSSSFVLDLLDDEDMYNTERFVTLF